MGCRASGRAASLRRGLEETAHRHRLGVRGALKKTRSSPDPGNSVRRILWRAELAPVDELYAIAVGVCHEGDHRQVVAVARVVRRLLGMDAEGLEVGQHGVEVVDRDRLSAHRAPIWAMNKAMRQAERERGC